MLLLDKIDTVQNRAIRLFLGVHKFAPNKAVTADMGWVSSRTRRHIEILRLWNRLVNMEPTRLTKQIFMWDKGFGRGWCKNVRDIMSEIDCTEHFTHNVAVDLASARTYLHNIQCEK